MPSTVGGAGFHADGKLPRYREVDFRLASELGPVDGAAVADWPLDYDELEPFYAEAERLIGVAGDHTGNPFAAWRSGPYPMPPGADMFLTTLTVPAAEQLGLPPVPRADRRQQRPVRRSPGVQQLRVLRLLRLPDRRQGRPGRDAAAFAATRPLRPAPREHRAGDPARRRRAPVAAACATSTATASSTRSPPTRSWWRAARSRPRGSCCAAGSATRRTWSAGS